MDDNLKLGLGINFDASTLKQLDQILTYVKKLQKQFDSLDDPLKKTRQSTVDLNAELAKININVMKSVKTVENIGKSTVQTFEKAKNQIVQVTKNTDGTVIGLKNIYKTSQSITSILGYNVAKMAEWALSATLLYGTFRSIQRSFEIMLQLETEAVNIAKVLPEGVSVTPFEERSIQLAKQYGQSILNVEKATANWAKQYKNVQDVAVATQASILAATATDIIFEDSVRDLSAILAEWNLQAKNSIHIVDILNEESNNYRITAQGLADALAKSGSAARSLGLSMEQLAGIATVGIQTLGIEGNQMGTVLTRIFARIRGSESAIKAINALGIDAMQPLSTLLTELSAKWDLMSDGQKQNLAITIAGTQHWSRFIGIMDNYNTIIEATAKAYNSMDSAQKEIDRVMQTTAKHLEQLNATWQEYIYRNSGVLNITKAISDILRNLIVGLAQFNPMVVIAGITALTFAFQGLFAAILSTTTAFSVMTVGLLSNPWTAVIAAIVTVAGALLLIGNNANKSQNEILKMQTELTRFDTVNEGIINKSRGIIDLANKYEIYRKAIEKAKNTGQDYSKLSDKFKIAQSELAKAIGVSTAELDLMIKKDGSIKQFVENRLKENAALINSEREKANAIALATKKKLEDQLKPLQQSLSSWQKDYAMYTQELNQKQPGTKDYYAAQALQSIAQNNINSLQTSIKVLQDQINGIKISNYKTTVKDFYTTGTGVGGFGEFEENVKDKIQPIFTDLTSETLKSIEIIGRSWQDQINAILSPDEQLKDDRATYVLKGQEGLLSISSDINRQMRDALIKPFEEINKAGKTLVDSLIDIYRQREKLKATGEYNPQEEVRLQKDIVKAYELYQIQLQEQYNILEKVRQQLNPTSQGFKELTQVMANVNQQIEDAKFHSDQQNKVIKQYNVLMDTVDGLCTILDKFGDSTEQAISSFIKALSKIVSIGGNDSLNFDWQNATKQQKGDMISSGVNLVGELFGLEPEESNMSATGAGIGFQIGGPWGAAIGGILGLLGGHNQAKARKKFEAAQKRGNQLIEEYNKRMVDTNYGDTLSELSNLETRLSNTDSKLSYRTWYGKKKYKENPEYVAIQEMIKNTQDAIRNMIIDLSKNLRSAVVDAFSATTSFVEFSQNLYQSVYGSVKEALLNAFVSSETMKPLFNNLSKMILDATMDGMLTAEEVLAIKDSTTEIGSRMQVLYQSLGILDQYLGNLGGIGGSDSGEGGYTAGTSNPMIFNNYITIDAGIFMGDEDQARQVALWLRDYIVAEEQRG